MTRRETDPKRAEDPLATAAGADDTLPLLEERVRVGKRSIVQGRVEVRTRTETREDLVREVLTRVDVEAHRVPIGRTLADGEAVPQVRTEGTVTIIPIVEEVLVVEKRLVLTEEIHLERIRSETVEELPVTLRKQTAVIEKT